MYAIIDIETTGGSSKHEKITEIAVYIYDGRKITEEFSTLINPERNIPYYITSLTGISNEMVEDAPRFFEVARRIIELTEDKVFVAHNARFDYSFIRQEFSSLGFNFKRPLLDTVALSRKLLPGHRSYSLGNLCSDLGISISGRHRAAGDALATTKLFEILLEKDRLLNSDTGSIIDNPKNSKLNPALDPAKIESIPEEAGVYYFHDANGEIIYIGKSRNLYERVKTHLSNNKTVRAMEMRDRIADISWENTGSELIALLLESSEIKSFRPLYNRAQRRTGYQWGIFSFYDNEGYIRFEYRSLKDEKVPLALFTSMERARNKLGQMREEYSLCQKLCGLYDTGGPCFQRQVGICHGACTGEESPEEYNVRAKRALEGFSFAQRNIFIIDKGRNNEERAAVKIVNGKYCGFGYFNINELGFGLTALHDCIKSYNDNQDIRVILKGYLNNHKVERIIEF